MLQQYIPKIQPEICGHFHRLTGILFEHKALPSEFKSRSAMSERCFIFTVEGCSAH